VRIVISDFLGHAAPVQLSRSLASRGHSVLHLYSGDVQGPKADLVRQPEDSTGLEIRAIGAGEKNPQSQLIGSNVRRYGHLLTRAVLDFKPDVVMAGNNPLAAQRRVLAACRRANIPFVYWLRRMFTLEMDRAVAEKPFILRLVAEQYFRWLEGRLLHLSDAIVPIAEYELALLEDAWGISKRQTMVVRDWAPLDKVSPRPRQNDWSRSRDLDGRKVILYTGTLDWRHHPGMVVELAAQLQDRPDVLVLVVSDGEGAAAIRDAARARQLANLRVEPFQPYATYADVLASADILFAAISDRAGLGFVPTKIASYLCAGRPIVLCAEPSNLAADMIVQSGGGIVVHPDDVAGMRDAVMTLLDDEAQRQAAGACARTYAEQNFAIGPITERFERLFERLHTGPRRSNIERRSRARADGPSLRES
jgi:colanic acid biosynthesis glycosyl transferase WcaI